MTKRFFLFIFFLFTVSSVYAQTREGLTKEILDHSDTFHLYELEGLVGQKEPSVKKDLTINKDISGVVVNEVPFIDKGFQLIEEKKFEDALVEFQKAVLHDPKDGEAYLGLAYTQTQLNQTVLSKINFLRAKELYEEERDFEGVHMIEQYLKALETGEKVYIQ